MLRGVMRSEAVVALIDGCLIDPVEIAIQKSRVSTAELGKS